jgi:hypothetical protein
MHVFLLYNLKDEVDNLQKHWNNNFSSNYEFIEMLKASWQ